MTTPSKSLPTEPTEVTAIGVFPADLVDGMRQNDDSVEVVRVEMAKLLRAQAYHQWLRLPDDGEFSFQPFIMDPAVVGDLGVDHRGVRAWATCVPWPDAGLEPWEDAVARADADRAAGRWPERPEDNLSPEAQPVGWPGDMAGR